MLLEVVELWVFIENMFAIPNDLALLTDYNKKEMKENWIIFYLVKDY